MNPDQCPACRNPQGSPLSVRCTRDLTMTAHFEQNPFPVAVLTSGRGSVSQSWVVNDGPDSSVVLTAQAEDGWQFVGWSGDLAGKDNPVRVQLSGALTVTASFQPAAAAVQSPVVTELSLAAVAPNPARGRAGVDFGLPAASGVTLDVIDVQGRQVASLIDGTLSAGRHHAEWNGPHRDRRASGRRVLHAARDAAGHADAPVRADALTARRPMLGRRLPRPRATRIALLSFRRARGRVQPSPRRVTR
jgi:uncharacterized repeat protein (TIGR02543 family)